MVCMIQKHISTWLYSCAFMIFLMVVLGGLTRLTHSGLSMVDWRPITGFLPPLSLQQWHQVFDLYKQSPEFLNINYGMDLAGFKSIFWLEYIHRLWGRLIGLVFFIPLMGLTVRKQISTGEFIKFFGIFFLGAAQGVMGWYMVKSGLIDDPQVSPYRLTAHLLLAFLLFSLLLWQGLHYSATTKIKTSSFPWKLLTLIILTIFYGGLVAGHKAGYIYNTFPLMGGQLIPGELFFESPWFMNFFTNPAAVQFIHRLIAILTFIYAHLFIYKKYHANKLNGSTCGLFLTVLWGQLALGITTLLTHVDISFAALHQANALVLLAASLLVAFRIQYGYAGKLTAL